MIRIEKLSKSFGDKVILNTVSYHFPAKERIALVGANGQGKTTLLNIICGLDYADDGQIIRPNDMRVSFLPQSPSANPMPTILQECLSGHKELFQMKERMDDILHRMTIDYNEAEYEEYDKLLKAYENGGGYQLEGMAEKIILGLGFTKEQLEMNPTTLSGGWRMRLELAKVLLAKPDFLILDEPTNHLDLPSIEWLETYLLSYQGTLLLVSHDKEFLNSLSTITVYLNRGSIQIYSGNFDSFLEQREQVKETQQSTIRKIKAQQSHMQSFVDRFKAKASKARQAQSRMKMIEKLDSVLSGITVEEGQSTIHIPRITFPPSGKDAIDLRELTVGYTKPLISKVNLLIRRGQRIAIVGANGMGKSTLLKTICGTIPSLEGQVVLGHNARLRVYTQDAADRLDKKQSVYDTLRIANQELTEQMSRAMLGAFLFKGHDLAKQVGVLSGGEKSRLALCCLLTQQPNILLLDEPTNHLDMASIEILAEMLNQYTGTVVFVSHDRHFVEEVATSIAEVSPKGKLIL